MPKIADPSLKDKGRTMYEWAKRHMPVLVNTIDMFKEEKPLSGIKTALCLHVTKETAVLAMGLKILGANVSVCGSNPLSTQDEIAAYLESEGIDIYAWRGQNIDEYYSCIRSVLNNKPNIITDDGADMHVLYHTEKEKYDFVPIGGTEETTTGVNRLRALEKQLYYPIIAVNNAYTKHLFDNRYGTGQSTIDGILRATGILLAGKNLVVAGYGWVGKGIANRARGMGAKVIVTEVDPIKALEAYMDGFEVMSINEASKYADVIITATGQINVIREEHIKSMKDGVILANAGHFDVEIDVKWIEKNAKEKKYVRDNLEEYNIDGKKIYLIGKGRLVNLVAAEGHPPEVMDLSFTNQLLSIIYIVRNREKLESKLYNVPIEIDRDVAINALKAYNISIDKLTDEQIEYLKKYNYI